MYPYNYKYGQTIQTDVPGIVADRGFIANLHWTSDETAVSDDDGIFAGIVAGDLTATPAGTAVTVTPASDEFVAQPPCARNVVVVVNATTEGHVKGSVITVTGTNIADEEIEEDFTVTADTADTLVGIKAFKTVTSVEVPAQDGNSVTVDVGYGELLGMPYKLSMNTIMAAYNDGTAAAAGTVVINAQHIENNTIDFQGSLDGSVMDVYLIV